MKMLLTTTLLASIFAGGAYRGIVTKAPALVDAQSWSTCYYWWGFEESAVSNATDGSGSGYTLTDVNGVARNADSGYYKEGVQSASITGSSSEQFTCTSANCPNLNQNGGDITFGCWIYPTSTGTNRQFIAKYTSSTTGYRIGIGTGGNSHCAFNSTQATVMTNGGAQNTWNLNGCTFNTADTSTEIKSYLNGALNLQLTSDTATQTARIESRVFMERRYCGANQFPSERILSVRFQKVSASWVGAGR